MSIYNNPDFIFLSKYFKKFNIYVDAIDVMGESLLAFLENDIWFGVDYINVTDLPAVIKEVSGEEFESYRELRDYLIEEGFVGTSYGLVYTTGNYNHETFEKLTGGDFGEYLDYAVVYGATFESIDSDITHISCCEFTRCIFSDCDFGNIDIFKCSFRNCVFERCSFRGATITDSDFTGQGGGDFSGAKIESVKGLDNWEGDLKGYFLGELREAFSPSGIIEKVLPDCVLFMLFCADRVLLIESSDIQEFNHDDVYATVFELNDRHELSNESVKAVTEEIVHYYQHRGDGALHGQLNGLRFDGMDLRGIVFNEVELLDSTFHGANLNGAEFYDCEFKKDTLEAAIVDGATFSNCTIGNELLTHDDLENAAGVAYID